MSGWRKAGSDGEWVKDAESEECRVKVMDKMDRMGPGCDASVKHGLETGRHGMKKVNNMEMPSVRNTGWM